MKKIICLLFVLMFCLSVFAVCFTFSTETNWFDSVPMLNEYYNSEDSFDYYGDNYYDDVTISLITVSAGKPLYSWFGHSAVQVQIPNVIDIMYDWGRFSFGKKFYYNFLLGNLWYKCGASYSRDNINIFNAENRKISKTILNLTNQQKHNIVQFLMLNSSDEYSTYCYRFLDDNCATRIRDLINASTNGEFEKWAKTKPNPSYRTEIRKIVTEKNIAVAWFYDYFLSASLDKPQTLWEGMFLPENLEYGLNQFSNLATSEEIVSDNTYTDSNIKLSNYDYIPQSLIFGLILSLISCIGYTKVRYLYKVETFLINLVFGIMGVILLFFMVFTRHDVTYFNENIIFINPVLIVLAFMSLNYTKHTAKLKTVYLLFCIIICVLVILKISVNSVFSQHNYEHIATMLPYYITNAILLRQKR